MTANLFKTFSNLDHKRASSSTSNVRNNTNTNIDGDESFEEESADESLSDSSCEFINENANYDTTSSVDDQEDYDTNSTLLNCPNTVHGSFLKHSTTNCFIIKCSNNTNINPETVSRLKLMLDEFNTHAKSFRMAVARLKDCPVLDLELKLIADRSKDGRIYNQATISEVAALIIGDVDTSSKRDIILERRSGRLKRISEFHPSYLALQYPLLFPYGEDGFRLGVLHKETNGKKFKKNKFTIREWLTFRIQTLEFKLDILKPIHF
ncbi:uncharacterized protein LOC131597092 [Vicia villosa]|uniref:uncharacterized protein LOC131597092 n=1 Tax=Vicia villosa TaxID=3911 RepID=UPI00273CE576|nr:uncharacterized protein LOC131597092 [Vicia villosa]